MTTKHAPIGKKRGALGPRAAATKLTAEEKKIKKKTRRATKEIYKLLKKLAMQCTAIIQPMETVPTTIESCTDEPQSTIEILTFDVPEFKREKHD